MSLINQVLQDLERRHASNGDARSAHGALRVLREPPRGRGWAMLTAAALALALGGGVAWWLLPRQEATAARPALPAPVAQAAATPPPALPVAEPVLTGMPEPAVPPVPPPVAALERKPLATARASTTLEQAPKSRPKPEPVAPAGTAAGAGEDEPEPEAARAAREELVVVEEPGTIDRQERWGSTHERAEAEFKRGMRLYQDGRASEAEIAWRGALETDPANESARHALLGLLLERGERAEAERLLREGLLANPAQTKLGMVLARLQLDRGAQGEALQTLEAGLPQAQRSAEYLTMTAAVMTRAGRHREAAALYESALRMGPGNAVWHMGLGLALRADGRHRDALAAFQRARDLKALNPELQAFVERHVRELQQASLP